MSGWAQAGGIAAAGAAILPAFSWLVGRAVERRLPPQGRFMQIDGHRLHYLDLPGPAGEGAGPPIVMIHGLGGQTRNFTHSLTGRLAGRHRLVVVDRPGSGHSGRPRGGAVGLRAQAALIARLVAALDLGQPLVVGHSLGGAVALAMALEHPRAVGALALLAPLSLVEERPPAEFRALAVRSATLRALLSWTLATPLAMLAGRALARRIFAPDPLPADFATAGGGLLGLRPRAFRAASADMVAINDDLPGMVARYRQLALPVAVLFGTEDRILDHRRHGLALKAHIPQLDLSLVPGGHMLPVAAAETAAAWITEKAVRLRGQEARVIPPPALPVFVRNGQ